jgi:hypothetical protein
VLDCMYDICDRNTQVTLAFPLGECIIVSSFYAVRLVLYDNPRGNVEG